MARDALLEEAGLLSSDDGSYVPVRDGEDNGADILPKTKQGKTATTPLTIDRRETVWDRAARLARETERLARQ
jgi:hypothetical protein